MNTNTGKKSPLARRRAGIVLHLTSLSGPYGIGDISDGALSFIDALTGMHLGVWQFLPTGPTAYGNSPYQPLSVFAGNENLIGIEPLLRAGLIDEDEAQPLRSLPENHVDYARLITAKNTLLARAAKRFMGNAKSKLKAAYEDFLHLHDEHWLDDYALYRVLKTRHGERPWPEWDRPYALRGPDAIIRVRNSSAIAIERVKFIQFLFYKQWQKLHEYAKEKNVCLFADMPIYIALDSVDSWAHPELLRIAHDGRPTHVAGVPPDYFSEDGQLWGNPLYDWDYHAASGYQWWTDRLRHASCMADLVRIDHFRGFEAYWSVPAESANARKGTWEPGPGSALFEAMRNELGQLPIVAEDLGMITPQVDALRNHHGIRGMKVLQFELSDPDFQSADIKEHCVCYTGTHDNDTTVGWFRGGDNDTRTTEEVELTRASALQWTGGTKKTIHLDMIRLAFASQAKLAMAPMQDYLGLGSEARLNVPGTTGGNWSWRLQAGQLTPELCETVREFVRESSRG